MEILFLIGRLIFGGFFLYNAYGHFKNVAGLTGYAKAKGIPMARAAVIITGVLMAIGGLTLVLGVKIVFGLWCLLLFMVPTTFLMHAFWKEGKESRQMEQIQFAKNMAIIGAILMMIAMAYITFS